jgi:hypothetical protein
MLFKRLVKTFPCNLLVAEKSRQKMQHLYRARDIPKRNDRTKNEVVERSLRHVPRCIFELYPMFHIAQFPTLHMVK